MDGCVVAILCVVGGSLILLAFLVGWASRSAIEQRIREEYRLLFRASRKAIQGGDAYGEAFCSSEAAAHPPVIGRSSDPWEAADV